MYLKNCLSVFHVRKKSESLYPRLLRYLDEAYRDELIGDGRYAVALGKAKKLQRFLIIKGRPSLPANAFTADMLLEFRRFIQDEYKYVSQHPELYPRGGGHRPPQKRFRNTTVVHDLKLLQAFFTELENTGEIRCSPFRKITPKKLRVLMHVMYDAPIYLRAEEMRQVMATAARKAACPHGWAALIYTYIL